MQKLNQKIDIKKNINRVNIKRKLDFLKIKLKIDINKNIDRVKSNKYRVK